MDNRIGGVQNRILSLGPGLNLKGLEIHVSAPSAGGGFLELAEEVGLIPHTLGVRTPPSGAKTASLFAGDILRTAMATQDLITEESIDVVHVNGLLALGPALGARISGLPILWHLIGTHYPRPLVRILMPLVRSIATEVAFVSEEVRGYYYGQGKGCLLIPESVDTERFHPVGVEARNLQERSADDKICIGFLGNVTSAKGLEYLFRAIPLVVSEHPRCRFIIGGTWVDTQWKYQKRLRDLVESLGLGELLRITGTVSDTAHFYHELDVFCLPSIAEGMPIVVLEAMASGLPVVATSVAGIPSMVTSGVEGYLVPPRDPRSLASAIARLAASQRSRSAMGGRARIRVERHFSSAAAIRRYAMLYRRLARSPQSDSTGI